MPRVDEEERTVVLGMLLEEILAYTRTLPGSRRLQALVVFDEVYRFLPPHSASRRVWMLGLRLAPRVLTLSTALLTPAARQHLWNVVVLTPSETLVMDALRIVEPTIERVAPAGSAARLFLALVRGGVREATGALLPVQ